MITEIFNSSIFFQNKQLLNHNQKLILKLNLYVFCLRTSFIAILNL